MSSALARIEKTMSVPEVMDVAKAFSASGYFKDARDAAQAAVKIMAGQELGIPPVAAMTGIVIVKEKVTLSANMMAALVKSSGRYNYRVVQHTDSICEIAFFEGGQQVGTSSFSMDEAKRANLSGANWTQYPKAMLFARAMTQGVRWYCPDVLSGIAAYTPEELGESATVEELPSVEVDAATGEVIEAEVVEQKPKIDPSRQKIIDAIEADWKARQEFDPAFGTAPRRFNSIKGWVNANGSTPWDGDRYAGSKADSVEVWLREAFIDDLIDYGKHNRKRLNTEKADAAREAEQSMSEADGSEGIEVDE